MKNIFFLFLKKWKSLSPNSHEFLTLFKMLCTANESNHLKVKKNSNGHVLHHLTRIKKSQTKFNQNKKTFRWFELHSITSLKKGLCWTSKKLKHKVALPLSLYILVVYLYLFLFILCMLVRHFFVCFIQQNTKERIKDAMMVCAQCQTNISQTISKFVVYKVSFRLYFLLFVQRITEHFWLLLLLPAIVLFLFFSK